MKSKSPFYLPLLLLFSALLFTAGCKKDDDPNGTNNDNNTNPTTGEITFNVWQGTSGSNPQQGLLVGLATTEAALQTGNTLVNKTTDALGKANFKNLAPLTYFYAITGTVDGNTIDKRGSFELQAGDDLDKEIVIP